MPCLLASIFPLHALLPSMPCSIACLDPWYTLPLAPLHALSPCMACPLHASPPGPPCPLPLAPLHALTPCMACPLHASHLSFRLNIPNTLHVFPPCTPHPPLARLTPLHTWLPLHASFPLHAFQNFEAKTTNQPLR